MEKLGDVYLDFNQNESNIDDLNLNAVWVDLDKGTFKKKKKNSNKIFKTQTKRPSLRQYRSSM